jgi:hypothetical protein
MIFAIMMGFAKYIHPKQNDIFYHIARIAKKYIITVDNEITFSPVSFPRNLRKMFQNYNYKEIDSFMFCETNFPSMKDKILYDCWKKLMI